MSLDLLALNPVFDQGAPQSSGNLPFVLFENERLVYKSPNRVSVHLNATHAPEEIKRSKNGIVYVTNQRLVFISENQYDAKLKLDFNTLELPINDKIATFSLVNSWFGSNKYQILFRPTLQNAGLNHLHIWKAVLYFNEGGIFDFDNAFQKAYTDFKYDQDDYNQLPAYSE